MFYMLHNFTFLRIFFKFQKRDILRFFFFALLHTFSRKMIVRNSRAAVEVTGVIFCRELL